MIPDITAFPVQENPWLRTIRPFGAAALSGIAKSDNSLIAIDSTQGYLLQIDLLTDNTTILNPDHVEDFVDATGLALQGDTLWFTQGNSVYCCTLADPTPQHFVSLPYSANGVAVWESTIYVSCQKTGKILIFSLETAKEITRLYAPGVGIENLTIKGEELWVTDTVEQTVYCLDRATGEIKFSVLTPFECPTGLAFHTNPITGKDILYVSYAGEEPYIRDNPNASPNY